MKNLSILPVTKNTESVVLSNGRVMHREEGQYHVLTEAGVVIATQKADGCLLDPEIDDLVLVTHGGRAGGFILCVLVKEGEVSRLTVKGEARLNAEEFTLAADRKATVEAPEVVLEGGSGELSFLGLNVNTSVIQAKAQKAVVTIRRLEVLLDRLTQRMRNCFRWVENLDQVKAGRISRTVKERFSLKSRHTFIRAEEDVTVDADRINLG